MKQKQIIYLYMPFASVTSDSLQPIEFCLPGSSAHGIHQARILEWVAMPSSRRFSPTSDQICISGIAGEFFATKPLLKLHMNLAMKKMKQEGEVLGKVAGCEGSDR